MYSRNWGGLETGSLGMAESGGVVERCEGLGVQGVRQGLEWSHGMESWGPLWKHPTPTPTPGLFGLS